MADYHRRMFLIALAFALPATGSAAEPAVDPLLTIPVEQVTPDQVGQMQQRLADWPQLQRYRSENAALPAAVAGQPRVVFFGDSITEGWGPTGSDTFFAGKGYVNRGISGQTTAQMLVRFRQDVVDLKPETVHIMAGTNDIAGNTGAATIDTVMGNIQSMAELARAHGIKVIIASVPPAAAFPWSPGKLPAPQVDEMNRRLSAYARINHFGYVDYHRAMAQPDGAMKPGLASDGVHPTPEGYAVMRPLALAAIAAAITGTSGAPK